MTRTLGVVAAMAAEARTLRPIRRTAGGLYRRNDGMLVSISGIGADAATGGARALAAAGATALVSFGMAGGLDPALRSGSIVLPDRVIGPNGSVFVTAQSWVVRLCDALNATVPAGSVIVARAPLLTVATAVDDVAEKAALFHATGAVAVDMESSAVAAVAAQSGLPFVAVRVIVDTARDVLPRSVVAASVAGQVHVPRLILGLLRAPIEVLPLLRLARRFSGARASLSAVAGVIGGVEP